MARRHPLRRDERGIATMSILPVMILVSMLVVLGAGIAFFWAVEHDQFEDLQSPAFLPLLDESEARPPADATAAEEAPAEPRST